MNGGFMLQMMNQAEFEALARQGFNRIPLIAETFADLDTALSLYLKLANQPFSYLLESVQGGERFGRYSIIGLPARTRIVARGRAVEVVDGEQVVESAVDVNPLDFVDRKSTRLNSSHVKTSYAVFCLKKKHNCALQRLLYAHSDTYSAL